VGLPPVAWQMLCRIRHGASLLADGASIIDAALASGLSDQCHFAHRFWQLMGMTPGQDQVAFFGSKGRQ
ncbi:MAG: helix-turn-helix domain-containing protein, partial [Halodesulfovibrio sp.]